MSQQTDRSGSSPTPGLEAGVSESPKGGVAASPALESKGEARTAPYAALVRGNFYRANKKHPYDRVEAVLEFAFPDGGEWGDSWQFAKDLLRPGRYFVLKEVIPAPTKDALDGAREPRTTP